MTKLLTKEMLPRNINWVLFMLKENKYGRTIKKLLNGMRKLQTKGMLAHS